MEILHHHDVAGIYVHLAEENPAAVRGGLDAAALPLRPGNLHYIVRGNAHDLTERSLAMQNRTSSYGACHVQS